MPIAFRVDQVTPAAAPRPVMPLGARLKSDLAMRAEAETVIDAPAFHPLIAAVHVAFAEHRPLALSPDAIWLTIAQGVAQHVRSLFDVQPPYVRLRAF